MISAPMAFFAVPGLSICEGPAEFRSAAMSSFPSPNGECHVSTSFVARLKWEALRLFVSISTWCHLRGQGAALTWALLGGEQPALTPSAFTVTSHEATAIYSTVYLNRLIAFSKSGVPAMPLAFQTTGHASHRRQRAMSGPFVTVARRKQGCSPPQYARLS
ncbi:hypothetical protein B0T24DRAFT_622807 [Lasiosphaeria ovina]|uniref:Uncharacterized protein n=1 Tax=Lasiosphaeria ovina TaxID=92902 RepID=A0AAE0KC58_9PEZI|nr:hypothetical protein B0T24DRAFT_622807 [Lasiosphaeria ovina]